MNPHQRAPCNYFQQHSVYKLEFTSSFSLSPGQLTNHNFADRTSFIWSPCNESQHRNILNYTFHLQTFQTSSEKIFVVGYASHISSYKTVTFTVIL